MFEQKTVFLCQELQILIFLFMMSSCCHESPLWHLLWQAINRAKFDIFTPSSFGEITTVRQGDRQNCALQCRCGLGIHFVFTF